MPRHSPNQPFELEHAERGHDLPGGHAGTRDQVVDGGRMIVQVTQERSFRVGKCQLGRVTDGWFLGIGADLMHQQSKLFQYVFDCQDQAGTFADQAMAAPAGPGNAKSSRFCSMACDAVKSDLLTVGRSVA